jgi:hypothetical protein
VLASGVTAGVPALKGRVLPGVDARASGTGDADCTGHGTALAGVVAATARPGTSFAGVAPAARLLPIRVTDTGDRIPAAEVTTALRAAADGGAAVALLGRPVDLMNSQIAAALRTAVSKGVTVVVPASDSAVSDAPATAIPDGVLRVGAVGPDGRLTGVYAAGAVDVVAPGTDVVTLARTGNGQVRVAGTEFAAAYVAGLAALLCDIEPTSTPADVAERIRASADGPDTTPDPEYGHGLINMVAAVGVQPSRQTTVVDDGNPVAATLAVLLATTVLVAVIRRIRR